MSRRLQAIDRRRAELVSRAKYERIALSGKRKLVSAALIAGGALVVLRHFSGSHSKILHSAGGILFSAWKKVFSGHRSSK